MSATPQDYAASARQMLAKLDTLPPADVLPTEVEQDRQRFEETQAVALAQAWGTLAVYELLRELRVAAIAAFGVLCVIALVVILGVLS